MTLREWRDRAFLDPTGYTELDWTDPIERTAMAMHALAYHTPEAVISMVTGEKGREELGYTWLRMLPADRQLRRRRAEMAMVVAAKDPLA